MNRRAEERVDFFQNLAIAVLAVSAVFLFSQTEAFRLGWQAAAGQFSRFPETSLPVEETEPFTLDAPVRVAVRNAAGRFGNLSLTTGEAGFRPVRQLLGPALGASEQPEEIRRAAFLQALEGTSLYCDFLHPLPLSVLAGLTGNPPEEEAGEEPSVRSAALARDGDEAALFLWDGGSGFYRRAVPVTRQELEQAVSRFGPGGVSFALDHDAARESGYRSVTPLSLFAERPPKLPVLNALSGLADSDSGDEQVLTALRFNPLTNYRYFESNGTQVVVENGRSVRIRTNGSVYYQSGGQADVSVESARRVPSLWEAAAGGGALLNALLSRPDGIEALYLREILRSGEQTVLRFDYRIGGTPVRFSDGNCAAEITLSGAAVSSLELRPRRYTATEADSPLLPLPQTLGIAGKEPGQELSVAYCDTGGTRVSAQWLSG